MAEHRVDFWIVRIVLNNSNTIEFRVNDTTSLASIVSCFQYMQPKPYQMTFNGMFEIVKD